MVYIIYCHFFLGHFLRQDRVKSFSNHSTAQEDPFEWNSSLQTYFLDNINVQSHGGGNSGLALETFRSKKFIHSETVWFLKGKSTVSQKLSCFDDWVRGVE